MSSIHSNSSSNSSTTPSETPSSPRTKPPLRQSQSLPNTSIPSSSSTVGKTHSLPPKYTSLTELLNEETVAYIKSSPSHATLPQSNSQADLSLSHNASSSNLAGQDTTTQHPQS